MTVDAASLLCCCAVEGVPQNCDDWLACAPDTMTITGYGVRRLARYVTGSPDSPFIEEEQTFSWTATLQKVPQNFRLEGFVSGTFSSRFETMGVGQCPGNPWCPSCGSCCSAVRRSGGVAYSGSIGGTASIFCAGQIPPFSSLVNTGVSVIFDDLNTTACSNMGGTCPSDPCDISNAPLPWTPPIQAFGWAGCASSSEGQAQWMTDAGVLQSSTEQLLAIGEDGTYAICYDQNAITYDNPLGIVCICAGAPGYCGQEPVAPCSPMHCPQYYFRQHEETYVIS